MPSDIDPSERPSKTQRKRDMQALKELAERLTELPAQHLNQIEDPKIKESVDAARKITKGNARKRQLQYIAKLLSKTDHEPLQQIVDSLDASSATYVRKFHQLEQWREQLIDGEADTMTHIMDLHPTLDRQQLRALIRNATQERQRGEQGQHYRKLFQFLKSLAD